MVTSHITPNTTVMTELDLGLLVSQLNSEAVFIQRKRRLEVAEALDFIADLNALEIVEQMETVTIFALANGQQIACDYHGRHIGPGGAGFDLVECLFNPPTMDGLAEDFWLDTDDYLDPESLAYAWDGYGE